MSSTQQHLGALFLCRVGVDNPEGPWEIQLKVKYGKIAFKIDTGAEVTVIGTNHLKKFGVKIKHLHVTNKQLIGPDHKALDCFGYFQKSFSINGQHSELITIYFCNNVQTALLGRPALQKFNLVKIDTPEGLMCATITKSKFSITEQFPSVFKGLGTIKGDPVHITVQENATPYHIGAPRRVAFPLLEPLKLELERMKEMGVIKIVNQPTDWCHPIKVVKKPNGQLRICIDLTQLNKDTKREFYELPSVDDTLAQLGNGCKYRCQLRILAVTNGC